MTLRLPIAIGSSTGILEITDADLQTVGAELDRLALEAGDEILSAVGLTDPEEIRAKHGLASPAALELDPPPAPMSGPPTTPGSNIDVVRRDFQAHPGQWRQIKDVIASTGLARQTVKAAVVRLRDRQELEHNGRPTRASANRWPQRLGDVITAGEALIEDAIATVAARPATPAEAAAQPAAAQPAAVSNPEELRAKHDRALTREELIADGVIKPATPDRVRGASRPVDAKPPDRGQPARRSALAGPSMPQTNPVAPPTPPAVSAKTRKALQAEQRDGPRNEATLTQLATTVLQALEREPGTARELAARLVRNINDIAAEISTLERTHPQLLTRRGRRDGGRIIYGRTETLA